MICALLAERRRRGSDRGRQRGVARLLRPGPQAARAPVLARRQASPASGSARATRRAATAALRRAMRSRRRARGCSGLGGEASSTGWASISRRPAGDRFVEDGLRRQRSLGLPRAVHAALVRPGRAPGRDGRASVLRARGVSLHARVRSRLGRGVRDARALLPGRRLGPRRSGPRDGALRGVGRAAALRVRGTPLELLRVPHAPLLPGGRRAERPRRDARGRAARLRGRRRARLPAARRAPPRSRRSRRALEQSAPKFPDDKPATWEAPPAAPRPRSAPRSPRSNRARPSPAPRSARRRGLPQPLLLRSPGVVRQGAPLPRRCALPRRHPRPPAAPAASRSLATNPSPSLPPKRNRRKKVPRRYARRASNKPQRPAPPAPPPDCSGLRGRSARRSPHPLPDQHARLLRGVRLPLPLPAPTKAAAACPSPRSTNA